MSYTRVASIVLVISGSVYAFLGWRFPAFWPGFLVFAGWIMIALGSKKVDRPWFWWLSFSWNVLWLSVLLAFTPFRSLPDMSLIEWHSRLHLALATILSVAAAIHVARSSRVPIQTPEPMRAKGPHGSL